MNDELRAVLTEALAGHQPENYGFNCSGCDWEPANPAVTDAAEFAAHQLDVLDTAPGVAVIQLPEPNSTRYEDDEFPPADRLAWWCPGSLFGISQWGYPNEVQIAYNGEPFEPVNIIEARFIAAALLAAAAAAVVAAGEEA
ncbi:hypothetical protein SEA_DUSSY_79 [Mycobacterium phage Dussy]|nr:hypothetical protein SEA_DUSSY_79 [Mycobacterium phage Dussy]UJQ86998.1 hypothetical protein SEA_ABBYSHOES_80 [Mycobacterium phage Abbyshoes]UVD39674.1 hypothetical protein SEA_KENMECH_82 [Mycobacterium phage Kenmech]